MGSPAMNPKILYRNSRLLRMVFLQLHRQQRADLFCDVVLQAEGEAVPAHCCILSACSPFFTERLEREMPLKGHKVVLELRGLKIGPLRKLVDFLYTSEMEVSREEAQDVLAAARQLQVSELESLQLEGGKLVKKALGRRLNRQCLQLSSPVSFPEVHVLQSPPNSGGGSLISHLLARKQCTGGNHNTGQKESVKDKTEMLTEDKHQIPEDPAAMSEFLKTRAKKRIVGTVRSMQGYEDIGSLHTEQAMPRDKQATAGLQVSKKIKLSRPKLSPPLPMSCATKDNSVIISSKTSKSIRRLWRKKSPPVKNEAKEAEVVSHGFLSPPLLPKATKGRKRNSSEPAPNLVPPQETGQVGRVKLRKVINGSCWEVVQEPSAAESTRAALCASTEKGSLPQPRHPKQEVIAMQQQSGSTKCMPANAESLSVTEKRLAGEAGSVVLLTEGKCVNEDSYQLLMPDQLVKGERYDNLASARELENMLDLLLADEAVEESQGTRVAESVLTSGHAPKLSNTLLGNAGAEEKLLSSAEVSIPPQRVKAEKSPLQGVEGCADFKISKGTFSLTNGVPFLDPVHGCLPLPTFHSSNDCIPLCSPTSSQQDGWTARQQLPVLDNEATRLAASLPTHENQGLLSSGATTSGGNTKPQFQPLQHHLDCKLPPHLAILEEDEIDIGGVEKFFNVEYVRPDPSPVSENEVDVVN